MAEGAKVQDRNQLAFESTIQGFEAEIANAGTYLALDARARQLYTQQIKQMADELRLRAASGAISWEAAALEAQQTRNTIMSIIRGRSTPLGRAIAERLKHEGVTLDQLVEKKTKKLYGPQIKFGQLTPGQRDKIFADIVTSAGKSNPQVTQSMRRLSRAGRGLLVLSVGLSVYQVLVAENKTQAATRELAVTGAGIGGGIAGGALAGLACGPGAPVCVTLGAFIGGALAAIGTDSLWQ